MNKVTLKDGRIATVEETTNSGLIWVRDEKGHLSSFDNKTGWSSDGNWVNDRDNKLTDQ